MISTSDIEGVLATLNPEQRSAAVHDKGPMVVFAGAGSGKTRIITSRIALLISRGINPYQILAVTFTNKAAAEMRERVCVMSPQGKSVAVGTFHSVCARWLRELAPSLGFTSDYSIFDEKDSLDALKKVLEILQIKDKETIQTYRLAIARVKSIGLFPHEISLLSAEEGKLPDLMSQVYKSYQEHLASCNAMDFADLLLNVLLLLKRDNAVKSMLQRRYRYVLVDEFQDTNPLQFALINHLINEEGNLFVVGDDDQSIYSWRGADPSNILEFSQQFENAITVRLEQNYRCTKNIIDAASAVIKNNKIRAKKTLWTANRPGDKLTYHLALDGELESYHMTDCISRERAEFAFADVAIFYRTNAQSRQIEESLRYANIPYRILGTLQFYDRVEIKDMLAYFRILINERDAVAFRRVINTPTRGLGAKAIQQIQALSDSQAISFSEAIKILASDTSVRFSKKLREFVSLLDDLKVLFNTHSLADAYFEMLGLLGYPKYLTVKFPEAAEEKVANVQELGAALASYEADITIEGSQKVALVVLGEWLQQLALTEQATSSDERGAVSLMTLHSAKGLEFSRVYIAGVEDGMLPHQNSLDSPPAIEEERRLFYVGITRAKQKLSILAARKRRIYNQWTANKPSRFLEEIPKELWEDFSEPAPSKNEAMIPGIRVKHPTYGNGIVQTIDEYFGNMRAVVDFDEFGKRNIFLNHLETVSS
jgi:DNA helicase-2/ATP-dependent DNA helicase PcrA